MKVLVISAAFPPLRAGESDHALHLSTNLAGQGLEVHVLTTNCARSPRDVPFTLWPIMRDWSWPSLPRLARFIKQCAPDAILLIYSGWVYNDHPMITFIPTIARRLLPRVRFVSQLEIGSGSSWKGFGARVVRKAVVQLVGSRQVHYAFGTMLRDSDRLIVLSEVYLARFSALLAGVERRSLVIPPPALLNIRPGGRVVREQGRASLGAIDGQFLLAFFGYVDRTKGIETLFTAVEIVSRRHRQVRLIMVGGGRGTATGAATAAGREIVRYEQEMLARPGQLGITDQVVWTPGYGSDSDEGSMYLQAVDAVVLPFTSGVALHRSSVAAAAAHGVPIITTEGPQLETPFRNRENVLLCPPNDAESLAAAIQSLIEDSGLRERLGKGAAALAAEWFSWERTVERTLAALGGEEPLGRDTAPRV